jgi:putative ABC transport system ATP-binding protein
VFTSAASSIVVNFNSVSKVFHAVDVETHAISNVSFEIARGEYLAFCGPSGCGKSTLLSLIGLLDVPTAGRYQFEGINVASKSRRERASIRNARVGFVFQSFNLLPDLSVVQNVELPLIFQGTASEERRERALRLLDAVGMLNRKNHFPAQLSGGQQQRVAVARALVTEPALVLADEPTGNLDSTNGKEIMKLLADANAAGATVCLVTHDVRYLQCATRQLHLFDGQLASTSSSA